MILMSKLLEGLRDYGADVDGVLDRFMDDEELFLSCLSEFVEGDDFEALIKTLESKSYDDAFEVAHALKGVTGNLGLLPLFNSVCVLVEALRAHEYTDIESKLQDVLNKKDEFLACYKEIS